MSGQKYRLGQRVALDSAHTGVVVRVTRKRVYVRTGGLWDSGIVPLRVR